MIIKQNVYLSILLTISLLYCKTYTLDELIDSSMNHSGTIRNSDILLEQSNVYTKQLRSTLLPQVTIFGRGQVYGESYDRYSQENQELISESYVKTAEETTGYINENDLILANLIDQQNQSFSMAPKNYGVEFGFSIKQPILQQGKVSTDIKISKINSSKTICNWQAARMELKANTTRLFYDLQVMNTRRSVTEAFYRDSEKQHIICRSEFQQGTRLELDTLASYLYVEKVREELEEIIQDQNLSILRLKKATGISDEEDVTIEGELTPVQYLVPYDSAVVHLKQYNKKITILNGEFDQAELQIERARRDYLPSIDAGIDFNYLSHFNDADYFSLEPERQLYLNVKYDLVRSGFRYYQLMMAQQNKEIIENRRKDVIRDLEDELKKYWNKWELLTQRLKRNEIVLSTAKKGISIAQLKYKEGDISFSELAIFNRHFLDAQQTNIDIIYQINMVIIDIRSITADFLYN